jgi:hypothetical protein
MCDVMTTSGSVADDWLVLYSGNIGAHRAATAASRSSRTGIRTSWSPEPRTESIAVLVNVGIEGASRVEVGEDRRRGVGRIKFESGADRAETAQVKRFRRQSNMKSLSESYR